MAGWPHEARMLMVFDARLELKPEAAAVALLVTEPAVTSPAVTAYVAVHVMLSVASR